MLLRAKLLALFLSVAVVPLLALGGVEYVRSLGALQALIAAQNARVAARAAEAVRQRTLLLQSDLLLLAENAETQRWLSGRRQGRDDSHARQEADRFVRELWGQMGTGYSELSYRDPEDRLIYQLGGTSPAAPGGTESLDPVSLPVRDLGSGAPLGTVALRPALAAILPLDLLASGFGETGYGMVLDRSSGRLLYHPDRASTGMALGPLLESGAWEVDRTTLERPSGTFRYHAGDSLRVASFVSLASPAWTVVVGGAVDEFAGPFTAVRRWTLLLFLVVALATTLVFSQLLRRTTRSLEDLTSATAVVGRGDFAPDLPPAGSDEVGRLTAAFGTMVEKVREMVHQIEASRQMAVLGRFAAHLSHEIRNPLTSIKLNLQKLDREAREGRLSPTAARPLEISLREVGRLDGVVRGVLDLAKPHSHDATRCSVHQLAAEALEVVAGQAEGQGVQLVRDLAAARDLVEADPARLKGAVLNLFLNALDAMPGGGVLSLGTDTRDGRIRITVRDTGPGIPAEARAEIFHPFFTTKTSGTGLGLPLARRAIEENRGTLTLADGFEGRGAEFVIELPLARET